jgi:hypothetical protein
MILEITGPHESLSEDLSNNYYQCHRVSIASKIFIFYFPSTSWSPSPTGMLIFFCVLHHLLHVHVPKPVIDHCPWPSSQFNKWHAQNKLLSSSLIVIGSSPWFTPPSNQQTIVAARLVQPFFITNNYTNDTSRERSKKVAKTTDSIICQHLLSILRHQGRL